MADNACHTHLVFLYGTLRRNLTNHYLLMDTKNGHATFLGKAETVQKYPFVLGAGYGVPFLLDAKGQGKHVAGEIYAVDDQMLQFLDAFEFHPFLYTRDEIEVKMLMGPGNHPAVNNTINTCFSYFLKDFKKELLNHKYIEEYTEDMKEIFLPKELDNLDQWRKICRSVKNNTDKIF